MSQPPEQGTPEWVRDLAWAAALGLLVGYGTGHPLLGVGVFLFWLALS